MSHTLTRLCDALDARRHRSARDQAFAAYRRQMKQLPLVSDPDARCRLLYSAANCLSELARLAAVPQPSVGEAEGAECKRQATVLRYVAASEHGGFADVTGGLGSNGIDDDERELWSRLARTRGRRGRAMVMRQLVPFVEKGLGYRAAKLLEVIAVSEETIADREDHDGKAAARLAPRGRRRGWSRCRVRATIAAVCVIYAASAMTPRSALTASWPRGSSSLVTIPMSALAWTGAIVTLLLILVIAGLAGLAIASRVKRVGRRVGRLRGRRRPA